MCFSKVGKILEKHLLKSSFLVKLQVKGCNHTKSEPLHRFFSWILLKFIEIIAVFISPISFYLSLSLHISCHLSLSLLALHYFEHSFHSYVSLSLLISRWEPTLADFHFGGRDVGGRWRVGEGGGLCTGLSFYGI